MIVGSEKKAKPNEIPMVNKKNMWSENFTGKSDWQEALRLPKKRVFFPLSAYMNKVAMRSEECNMFLGQIGLTHAEKKRTKNIQQQKILRLSWMRSAHKICTQNVLNRNKKKAYSTTTIWNYTVFMCTL